MSSSTAGRVPTRSKMARCGLTIVGAVSPEPMTTSRRVIDAATSVSRSAATAAGCWACRSWSPPSYGSAPTRAASRRPRHAPAAARARRQQQHRHRQRGEVRAGWVVPHAPHDLHVLVDRQPPREPAVGKLAEVGQRRLDGRGRPVGVPAAQEAAEPPGPHPVELGRQQRLVAGLPGREVRGEVAPTAVDQCQGRHQLGMRRRPSATTTLPPHDCPATTGRVSPSDVITAATSAAATAVVKPDDGRSDSPCPRRSTA